MLIQIMPGIKTLGRALPATFSHYLVPPFRSNLQSIVALSSTEAEYIALTDGVKEGQWLLVSDFGVEQPNMKIQCDSSSALALAPFTTQAPSTLICDITHP